VSTNELLEMALKLPEEDRAVLAHELLRSLGPEATCTEEEWKQTWATELRTRTEQLDRGEVAARDWPEVMADIRARRKRIPDQ
jgi:putative addiction module component (TIGR02574 family)